jgi:large subunit ribosomal protein L13e
MHQLKPLIVSQSGKERMGKGFSPDELKEAGLTAADAARLGISVDRKRKTSREENIETLKAQVEKAPTKKPAAAKKEKKPKN